MHLCDLARPDIWQTAPALATEGVHAVHRICMHTSSLNGHHRDLQLVSHSCEAEVDCNIKKRTIMCQISPLFFWSFLVASLRL